MFWRIKQSNTALDKNHHSVVVHNRIEPVKTFAAKKDDLKQNQNQSQ